jgi:uncharacterized protein YaaQ
MKLVIAIVSTADLDRVLRVMAARGYRATVIDQRGGFLRQGNVTLFVGVQEAFVADVLRLIGEICRMRSSVLNPAMPTAEAGDFFVAKPVESFEGGVVSYVLNVERYERIT